MYDYNQLATDDLRVLTTTAYVTPTKYTTGSISTLREATYEAQLPMDYLHLLNCVCVYRIVTADNCLKKDSYIEVPATRLTADSWNQIMMDVYNKPSPKKPYYYLHYQNTLLTLPTNPVNLYGEGTDMAGIYDVSTQHDGVATAFTPGSNFSRTFQLDLNTVSLIDKPTASRISNTSNVRIEIRYGLSDAVYKLEELQIDYIKSPQYINLTLELLDVIEDTSQIMEFPDYVNQEIINELVHLVMERNNDPRLSNNMLLDLTIVRPTSSTQQTASKA